MKGFIKYKDVTQDQAKDSGLAVVLILLLISHFFESWSALQNIAIIVLVVNMTIPAVFKPFALIWFSISGMLGNIMSTVLLTFVFMMIVTPIGFVRKILGKDPMLKKKWKQDSSSVFLKRYYSYSKKDMDKPY